MKQAKNEAEPLWTFPAAEGADRRAWERGWECTDSWEEDDQVVEITYEHEELGLWFKHYRRTNTVHFWDGTEMPLDWWGRTLAPVYDRAWERYQGGK